MSEHDVASSETREEFVEKEWREPPGYLGEAVRRAKLIPRGSRPPSAQRH